MINRIYRFLGRCSCDNWTEIGLRQQGHVNDSLVYNLLKHSIQYSCWHGSIIGCLSLTLIEKYAKNPKSPEKVQANAAFKQVINISLHFNISMEVLSKSTFG